MVDVDFLERINVTPRRRPFEYEGGNSNSRAFELFNSTFVGTRNSEPAT